LDSNNTATVVFGTNVGAMGNDGFAARPGVDTANAVEQLLFGTVGGPGLNTIIVPDSNLNATSNSGIMEFPTTSRNEDPSTKSTNTNLKVETVLSDNESAGTHRLDTANAVEFLNNADKKPSAKVHFQNDDPNLTLHPGNGNLKPVPTMPSANTHAGLKPNEYAGGQPRHTTIVSDFINIRTSIDVKKGIRCEKDLYICGSVPYCSKTPSVIPKGNVGFPCKGCQKLIHDDDCNFAIDGTIVCWHCREK
jgi:hypothetical protein